MRITALKYGQSTIPSSMAFAGSCDSDRYDISFTVYLIETAERRILIDAGCDTMPGWDMKYFESPSVILSRFGLSPEEITDVILTHSHHDHAQASVYFTSATFYVQREEYAGCIKFIPSDCRVVLFDDECEIAEGIKAVRISGHSVGSSIVVACNGEKNYVFCGDECYTRKNLTDCLPTGSYFSLDNAIGFVEKYGSNDFEMLLAHDFSILPDANGFVRIV